MLSVVDAAILSVNCTFLAHRPEGDVMRCHEMSHDRVLFILSNPMDYYHTIRVTSSNGAIPLLMTSPDLSKHPSPIYLARIVPLLRN